MTALNFSPDVFTRFAEMMLLSAIFCAAGYLFILFWAGPKSLSGAFDNPGMAVSAGLVLVMLVSFGLGLINIPVTRINLLVLFSGLCGLTIFRLLRNKANYNPNAFDRASIKGLETLIPLTIFFILLALRAVEIKGIVVPNWYDGLTHTSHLRDYLNAGRIPVDNIYHVGFHAIAMAVYSFLGTSPPETVLLLGQWLAAASGFTFYFLVYRYTHSQYIAGICSIVYSCFLLFPSYLVSFGRFPFLLGLVLLPFAILTTMDWVTNSKSNYWLTVFFIVALGLAHYGSLLLWFAFIFSYIINRLLRTSKNSTGALQFAFHPFKRIVVLILPLVVVILPKSINLYNHPSILSNMVERFQETSFDTGTAALLGKSLSENYLFFFLWIIWLPMSFYAMRRSLFITWLWPLSVWLFTWLQYKLLGYSISSYANLIIFLSLPLAFTAGFLLKQLMVIVRFTSGSRQRSRSVWKGFSQLLLLGVMFVAFLFPPGVDQEKVLLTQDDLLAIQWIETQTSVNSGFMIRTTMWSNKSLVPYDGGGWINFLTGRQIGFPEIGELYDLCGFSKQAKLDYIYFGPKPIQDGFDLRPEDLPEEYYSIAYQNQSVKIFDLNCP